MDADNKRKEKKYSQVSKKVVKKNNLYSFIMSICRKCANKSGKILKVFFTVNFECMLYPTTSGWCAKWKLS